MRAERAVEPTRSENITVTWRRSAMSGWTGEGDLAANICSAPSVAMALSRRLRCPNGTPTFSRSGWVSSDRTSASISFSRNTASYFSRPRLRSQLATSMTALRLSLEAHHRPGKGPCPGHGRRRRARNSASAFRIVAHYRTARDTLLQPESHLRREMELVAAEFRALPPGGEVPEDYLFDCIGEDGALATVPMRELFRRRRHANALPLHVPAPCAGHSAGPHEWGDRGAVPQGGAVSVLHCAH